MEHYGYIMGIIIFMGVFMSRSQREPRFSVCCGARVLGAWGHAADFERDPVLGSTV